MPTADGNAFGFTALHDFLQLHPEAFELKNDFRIVSFNINGLDGFKHAELLFFSTDSNMQNSSPSCPPPA